MHKKIMESVHQIGGQGLSRPADCLVYLVSVGAGESVMIDCGAGESFDELTENIASLGLEPNRLQALILTHCHIDHTGAAHMFKKRFGCEIIAHLRDSEAILGRDKLKLSYSRSQ